MNADKTTYDRKDNNVREEKTFYDQQPVKPISNPTPPAYTRQQSPQAPRQTNVAQSHEVNTPIINNPVVNVSTPVINQPVEERRGSGIWGKVAIGSSIGLMFGGAATFLASEAMAANEPVQPNDDVVPVDTPEPEIVPTEPIETSASQYIIGDNVAQAHSVNDDMTFAEAYEAARAEVGPGGVFEWEGNLYSTYTENEWDNMSLDEINAYNENFAWNEYSGSYYAEEPAVIDSTDEILYPENDYVDVTLSDNVVPENDDSVDVQVLGVTYDSSADINIATVTVDGQAVAMIDIDNDQVFDVMATDANFDGTIDIDTETYALSQEPDEQITVDSLGGYTDMYADDVYGAQADAIDYSNDMLDV